MAINVNTVYKTVLLILNKEERGYVTPDEFNKIATQVQLEIFEQYGEDLNQQLRVPQTDTDYANRVAAIDEHLSIFKTSGEAAYVAASTPAPAYFTLPTTDVFGNTVELYRLGVVNYKDQVELQRLQRMDFYNIQKSPLTKSTETFPTYLLENERLIVKPDTITSNINCDFLRKPLDPKWGFTIGAVGQYVYDTTLSTQIELDVSEQTGFILKTLFYFGVVVKDPQIIQVAASQIQQEENNSKS
jgi:hypothetical protein